MYPMADGSKRYSAELKKDAVAMVGTYTPTTFGVSSRRTPRGSTGWTRPPARHVERIGPTMTELTTPVRPEEQPEETRWTKAFRRAAPSFRSSKEAWQVLSGIRRPLLNNSTPAHVRPSAGTPLRND